MTKIVVDAALRNKLHDFESPLELCDEAGRVLARLFPEYDPAQLNLAPQISREEMLRRKVSNEKTYTTAEVLARTGAAMIFFVIWLQSALDELTELWIAADASLRKAITEASHRIDQALQRHPHEQGESRPDDLRIFFSHPLGITYEIIDSHATVRILHVWDIRRKQ